jgi:hypothetical protein
MNRPTGMNRHTSMTLLGLAIGASLQISYAQSDLETGIWQLNLAKSKFSPGPPPQSITLKFQRAGQNRKVTMVGFSAAGNPGVTVFAEGILPAPNASALHFLSIVEDGKPHPVTGSPVYDAIAVTRVDAYTTNAGYTKAGKVVQTGSTVISRDGKMMTITAAGTNASGEPFNNIGVYYKQ